MTRTRNALAITLLAIVASAANAARNPQSAAPGRPPADGIYPVYLEWEGRKLVSPTLVGGLPYWLRPQARGKVLFGYPASEDDPVLAWYRQARDGGERGGRRDLSFVEYCPGGGEEHARLEITQALPVAYKQVEREDGEVTFTETQVEFEHRGTRLVKGVRCNSRGGPASQQAVDTPPLP
jgi:hypothetical protein